MFKINLMRQTLPYAFFRRVVAERAKTTRIETKHAELSKNETKQF